MFRIGEFSRLTQVSIRMLRHYDEAGLLKPAYIDPFTNYRMYESAQIPRLNRIVFLRDMGFGVAQIASALARLDDESMAALLAEKRREAEGALAAAQAQLLKIERAQRDLMTADMAFHYDVSIKSVPGCPVLSLRRVVPDYYAEGHLWKELSAFAKATGASLAGDTFTIYHDPDYREADVDIELCAPVRALGADEQGFTYRHTDPVPAMASTLVYGSFYGIAGAYRAFAGWLQAHDRYRMGDHSRQIVHRGPWNEPDEAKYLTEIQIPLLEK